MKIIGVTGMSGAGKTTFTSFLGERKNVGVIHLDKVINDIKEDNFKSGIKRRNSRNEPMLFKTKTRYFINNHKLSFKIFMTIKRIIMKNRIEKQIAKFKSEGKDVVVIDGAYLTEMMGVEMFDSIVYLKRPYTTRIKAVQERDGVSREEVVSRDLPYKKRLATSNEKNFDYIVENTQGKEELKKVSQIIYDEAVRVKTFDEKYVVNSKETSNLKDVSRTGRRKNKSSKEKNER